jgi:hypothetical protein
MYEGTQQIGKILIVAGIIIVLIGSFLILSNKLSWLGKLPGDILIQRRNVTFYFPIATSILLSLLLTLLFWLFWRR